MNQGFLSKFLNVFDGLACGLGCVSLVPGCNNWIVKNMAFMPPSEHGYRMAVGQPPMVINKYGNYSPIPYDSRMIVKTLFIDTDLKSTIPMFHYQVKSAKKTIIFSHGNSTDLGYMHASLADMACRLKVNVLSYEYTGYSCSKGGDGPSEAHLYSDISSAYAYLVKKCQVAPADIILYGQSVGSAPTVDCASKNPVGGVIIHSGLRSGLSVMNEQAKDDHWFDVFKNAQKIRSVHCPVFVIHGTDDRQVKIKHGHSLFDNCPNPYAPWWVDGCGHNDIESRKFIEYYQRLSNFLSYLDSLPFPQLSTSSQASSSRSTIPESVPPSLSKSPSRRTSALAIGTNIFQTASASNQNVAAPTAVFKQSSSSSRSTSTIACVAANPVSLQQAYQTDYVPSAGSKALVTRNPQMISSQQSTIDTFSGDFNPSQRQQLLQSAPTLNQSWSMQQQQQYHHQLPVQQSFHA
eukprot:GDKJ01018943.1.p1 GENE.GDKJ01018943.1~~GDKJ01018943.1.p1  ORF type:complete len:462 (-),score=83.71 GDKJ01018943.1:248-1633(-)